MTDSSLVNDLDAILDRCADDLRSLTGARVFITGGTGFVGTWLLAALHHADQRLQLGLSPILLTRSPAAFVQRQPALARWVTSVAGDIVAVPPIGTVDAAIHAATPASAAFNDAHPDLMRETIVAGMSSVLEALSPSGAIPLLFTSSGAIYGAQPLDLERLPESFTPAAGTIEARNAYAHGKREAEAMAQAASEAGGPSLRLARLFAFVGPYLPLDAHFAIGNFIRDALAGGPIRVAGDGTAVRSYLYAGDMVEQLLAILVRGEPNRPYNVGSEQAISIADLARAVAASVSPDCRVEIAGAQHSALPTGAGSRYVPDTTRVRTELATEPNTSLFEAIDRTATHHRS